MASIIYVASPLSFSLVILLFFNFQHGIRASGWKILWVMRENIEGIADLWDSEYKPWRILRVLQTSETKKGVQVMQIGLWDLEKSTKPQRIFVGFTVLCETFFELKKSFFFALFGVWAFICSIFVGVSTAPFGDRANKCFAFSLESDNLLFTLLGS